MNKVRDPDVHDDALGPLLGLYARSKMGQSSWPRKHPLGLSQNLRNARIEEWDWSEPLDKDMALIEGGAGGGFFYLVSCVLSSSFQITPLNPPL